MIIKSRPSQTPPDVSQIRDEYARKFGEQLSDLTIKELRNIYDDIRRILPDIVDTLPTASAEFYQRTMIKRNTGALDTVHICLFNDATGAYIWKQISVS